ncbi:MAG: ATP-binding protein [Pseudomonadota bacterium]
MEHPAFDHPTLIIVQGFIAAGKSTYARSLATACGALHLEADAYCAQMVSESQGADWDRCFALAVERIWSIAEDRLGVGDSVIVDHGFWTRRSRDEARARAARLSVRLVHVYVTARDEVLRARMACRSGAVAERNVASFDALRAQFELPADDETAIVVNTADAGDALGRGFGSSSGQCWERGVSA